jgi:hypothetical protein
MDLRKIIPKKSEIKKSRDNVPLKAKIIAIKATFSGKGEIKIVLIMRS